MIGLLAHDALLVSLGILVLGLAAGIAGMRGRRAEWIDVSYAAVYTNAALVTLATLAMVAALVTHDFSVSYVAQVGSRETPLFYTVISLWSALEGSILFWAWVLSVYAAAAIWMYRRRADALLPFAAATFSVISLFFGILLVGPANPFRPVSPVPLDGPGPNPLLQNHILMAVHPPLLYLGYVGMSVPFAFAVGAMLSGEVNSDQWITLTRRWTIASWGLLSAAIVAGMWWSYEVLGWGGYWAWDPVENASLMPWLTATAFLHSVMVQERRGMLRLWNLNLVVGTFVLTILGTFLTRSGILSSVHAFTTGTIGYYFLGFIALVLIASLALVAGSSDKLRAPGRLDSPVSRETVFLLNNLFLSALMFTVLVGTLYPLVAEAIRGVKVSVGEPFFNRMSLPLILVLVFLMGVGPALPWRAASRKQVRAKLLPPLVGAGVVLAVSALFGLRGGFPLSIAACTGYALTANLREFWIASYAHRLAFGDGWFSALGAVIRRNPRRYGGYIAHLGILISALGVAASASLRSEREATIKPGQTISVAGHTVRLKQVWGQDQAQRSVIGATVEVLSGTRVVGTLEPRMNYYAMSDQPVPTPDVRSGIAGDLYLNLMAFESNGSSATLKVIVEPLVTWIWFGGLVVVLGAVTGCLPPTQRRAAAANVAVRDEAPRATLAVPRGLPT